MLHPQMITCDLSFLGCSCFSLKDSQMAAVLPFINAELWLLNDSVKGLHNGHHEFLQ